MNHLYSLNFSLSLVENSMEIRRSAEKGKNEGKLPAKSYLTSGASRVFVTRHVHQHATVLSWNDTSCSFLVCLERRKVPNICCFITTWQISNRANWNFRCLKSFQALAKIRAEMRSNSHVENSVKRNQRGYQGNQPICHYTFVPQFQQPFLEPNFQKRLVCVVVVGFNTQQVFTQNAQNN